MIPRDIVILKYDMGICDLIDRSHDNQSEIFFSEHKRVWAPSQ